MFGLSPPAHAQPAEASPHPEPSQPAAVISFPPATNSDGTWSRESALELARSIRAELQGTTAPPAPAGQGQTTAVNTATSAATASNATVAVPELASQVQQARRRGPGRVIAAVLLLLVVAAAGGGAYLWQTGKLAEIAPGLAALLPPVPGAEAPLPPLPAATATPAPEPPPAATAPPEQTPPPSSPENPTTESAATALSPDAPEAATPPGPAEAAPPPAPSEATAPPPPETAPAPEEAPALAAAQVKIIINSTPPGAKVTNNGQPVGQTPTELIWTSGQPVKIRLSMPGFRTTTKAFTPKVGGTLDVELVPLEAEIKDVY